MTARQKLTSAELDALLLRRQASAEAATKGRAHRALPLDEVERRAQLARKPWPQPRNPRPFDDYPDYQPAEAASGIEDEEPYNLRPQKPRPPAVPWRDLGAGLLVLLFTVACVHVIATATQPTQQVARR